MTIVRICALATLIGSSAFSRSTVLTFESTSGNSLSTTDFVGATPYGNRVTAATMGSYSYGTAFGLSPDIAVSYSSQQSTPNGWAAGYGTLTNVIWGDGLSAGVNNYSITFTADAGSTVYLHAFSAGSWSPSAPAADITVRDQSNAVLFSYAGQVSSAAFDLFNFSTPLQGQSLTITTSQGFWTGLDNVTFGQSPVPEPATLAVLGLGALALVRRRARQS